MFDSSLFLEIANKILSDQGFRNEGGWRTAIGRAYYAAFLATKRKLEDLGSNFVDVDRIHHEVIQELMRKNTDLGNRLDTLREKRVDADYDMSASIPPSLGQKCAKLSEGIISSVKRL